MRLVYQTRTGVLKLFKVMGKDNFRKIQHNKILAYRENEDLLTHHYCGENSYVQFANDFRVRYIRVKCVLVKKLSLLNLGKDQFEPDVIYNG